MKRDIELEATLVAKYAVVAPVLDERSRRRWGAAESRAIGYGGDAVVSSATGLARATIRKGRGEIARDEAPTDRIRRPGGRSGPASSRINPASRPRSKRLVDPLTHARRPDLAAALDVQESREHARGDVLDPLNVNEHWVMIDSGAEGRPQHVGVV